ncbi:hypothetical protein BZG36_03401 [Bifiguratus adelaidae]|uniref:Stress response protein NST1 n=1 Tax=Bifiguratus adelaidae TaxID=1938954 RepID=A0A261Y0F6_9FUNG|nr:hypothetical protein BZG36_03401 [Bifiguratus adelaidae]
MQATATAPAVQDRAAPTQGSATPSPLPPSSDSAAKTSSKKKKKKSKKKSGSSQANPADDGHRHAQPGEHEDPEDEDFYSDEELYNPEHPDIDMAQMVSQARALHLTEPALPPSAPPAAKKKKKKKKSKSSKQDVEEGKPSSPSAGHAGHNHALTNHNGHRHHSGGFRSTDNFWGSTNNHEERQKIREFWLQLGEEERRSLVKVEKEAVLKKMKEQQKHSCSCSVCGRKRNAIEEELEILYDAYYEELEHYANHQQHQQLPPPPAPVPASIPEKRPQSPRYSPEFERNLQRHYAKIAQRKQQQQQPQPQSTPPPNPSQPPLPPNTPQTPDSSNIPISGDCNSLPSPSKPTIPSTRPQTLPAHALPPDDEYPEDDDSNGFDSDQADISDDDYDDEDEEDEYDEDDDEDDEDFVVDEMEMRARVAAHNPALRDYEDYIAQQHLHYPNHIVNNQGRAHPANGDYSYPLPQMPHSSLPPRAGATPTKSESSEYFNFGNSLTVKGGILTVADDLLKNDGKKFLDMMERLAERRMQREEEAAMEQAEYDDYDDEDEDDYDDEIEDDAMTDEQRMEEGRRMFQIFAARMFEQRVLTAYREKVARERQQRLLEELEEEDRREKEKEAKKLKEKEKKRDKKRLLKQQKDEERQAREAERLAQEAAAKAERERKQEEQRKKMEEERARKEEERRQKEEERLRKEEEKRRRQREEREREAEKERKRKEKEEKERKEREEKERKEKEERLLREKEEREEKVRKEQEERDQREQAEREAAEGKRLERERIQREQMELEGKQRAEQAANFADMPVTASSSAPSIGQDPLRAQSPSAMHSRLPPYQTPLSPTLAYQTDAADYEYLMHHAMPKVDNSSSIFSGLLPMHGSPLPSQQQSQPRVAPIGQRDINTGRASSISSLPAGQVSMTNGLPNLNIANGGLGDYNPLSPGLPTNVSPIQRTSISGYAPGATNLLNSPSFGMPTNIGGRTPNVPNVGLMSGSAKVSSGPSSASSTPAALGQSQLSTGGLLPIGHSHSRRASGQDPKTISRPHPIAPIGKPVERKAASAVNSPNQLHNTDLYNPGQSFSGDFPADSDAVSDLHDSLGPELTAAQHSFFSSSPFGNLRRDSAQSNMPRNPLLPPQLAGMNASWSIPPLLGGGASGWLGSGKGWNVGDNTGSIPGDRSRAILDRAKVAYFKLEESMGLNFYPLNHLLRMMVELFPEVNIDARELLETCVQPGSNFNCLSHPHQGPMVRYDGLPLDTATRRSSNLGVGMSGGSGLGVSSSIQPPLSSFGARVLSPQTRPHQNVSNNQSMFNGMSM